jgi:hypothetical protein
MGAERMRNLNKSPRLESRFDEIWARLAGGARVCCVSDKWLAMVQGLATSSTATYYSMLGRTTNA